MKILLVSALEVQKMCLSENNEITDSRSMKTLVIQKLNWDFQ